MDELDATSVLALPYVIFQRLLARVLRRIVGVQDVPIDEARPANQEVLRYLRSRSSKRSRWAPNYYDLPYFMAADADQDSEFEKIASQLPEYCYSMCYGYPVLVHPRGGVIFAVARSKDNVFLRLPFTIREDALSTGIAWEVLRFEARFGHPRSMMHSSEVGEDWVFTSIWQPGESVLGRLFLPAYDYAGDLARSE